MRTIMKDVVSEITTGQIMGRVTYTGKETPDENRSEIRVLVPSAMTGGIVHKDNLGTAILKKTPTPNKITMEGDIIIKLSSPYDCALLTREDEGMLIPSFCGLLRGIRSDIVYPRFLLGYLNSDYARGQLLKGVNSSATSMVRQHSLQELELILPNLAEQILIGDAYWYSCQKKAMYEKFAQVQQRISDSVIQTSIQEVSRRGD